MYAGALLVLPHHTTTTVLRPFLWDHPDELVPEENFWTLWCKGRLTEADTPTIRLGTTPSGITRAHLHHPPIAGTNETDFILNICTYISASNVRHQERIKLICISHRKQVVRLI